MFPRNEKNVNVQMLLGKARAWRIMRSSEIHFFLNNVLLLDFDRIAVRSSTMDNVQSSEVLRLQWIRRSIKFYRIKNRHESVTSLLRCVLLLRHCLCNEMLHLITTPGVPEFVIITVAQDRNMDERNERFRCFIHKDSKLNSRCHVTYGAVYCF